MNIRLKHGTLFLGKGENGFFYASFVSKQRYVFHKFSQKGLAHALWLLELELKTYFKEEEALILEQMYETNAFVETERVLSFCSIRVVGVSDGRVRAACFQISVPGLSERVFVPGVYARVGVGATIEDAVRCAWSSLDYEKIFLENF